MSPLLNPPFRAEHIGSYLRPGPLLQKRAELFSKQCTSEELASVEDVAIRHVVELQRSSGIRSITDGEMRRVAFFDGVFEKLEGIVFEEKAPVSEMMTYVPYIAQFVAMGIPFFPSYFCKGKIKRTRGFYTDDFKFLKTVLKLEEVGNAKVTMCPPEWMHLRHGSDRTYDKSVYSNDEEYFADIAQAYREEIAELYRLGCRNIQFDTPTFAFFCAEEMVQGLKDANIDYDELLDKYIRLINDCLRDKPEDLVTSIHVCRGNYKGQHYCSGGYDLISKKLFNDMKVDAYYLEYDTERSGSFEPLKHLPPNKTVVLGLISTKTPHLENVEEMKRRINEAVDIISSGHIPRPREVALSQVCVSPQCGFASQYEGNPVTEEDEKRKLGLVVEVSNIFGSK